MRMPLQGKLHIFSTGREEDTCVFVLSACSSPEGEKNIWVRDDGRLCFGEAAN